MVFFNNRDIVGSIDSRCGQSKAFQNKVIRETMKIPEQQLLEKTFPYLFFVCVLIYFVFYYKSFRSTDIATNQM